MWTLNKKPVCFSSEVIWTFTISLATIFFFVICDHLCFPIWQTYFSFHIYVNNFWNCRHMCIYTKYLSPGHVQWQIQMFYICKPYLFHYIYGPFNIPHLSVKHVFTAMTFLLHFINNFYIWQTYLFFTSITTFLSLSDTYFSILIPITCKIIHTCILIQSTNAY